jgi:acetolactate synthase-1/2/3 large subunit
LKLADYLLERLKDHGITQVFQVYGAATGDIVDAFSRVKDIQYICPIHEQAGSFMVETIAKVTGRIQCFMATSGPGGINTLDGIANCYYDSTPALFITGQINSRFMRKTEGQRQIGFQENDIVNMAKPVTKYAVMIKDPLKIKYEIDKAIYIATHGRQGPVLLDIPTDLQKMDIDIDKLESYEPTDVKVEPNWYKKESIQLTVQALKESKRPVLLIGGGIHWANAQELARQLGIRLGIPCIPTWNATDIFTSDYPLYAGRIGTFAGPGRNFCVQNSDLLLAIGTRISGRITGGQVALFAREAKKIIVDIDADMLDKETQEVKGDMNVCMNGHVFIKELLNALREVELPDWSKWLEQSIEWRNKYQPVLPEYYSYEHVHPYAFIRELSKQCQSGDVIVTDSGGNCVVTFQCFETKYGQRLLSSNGNSTMGYSFAGAMGLCFLPEYLEEKKGRVICIIGDGGMQMNIQELQTLKHYGLKLKTFVLNNHCYSITTQFQRTNYGGRLLASGHGDVYQSGYSVPDFYKVANAYGIEAKRISNMQYIQRKIQDVLEYPDAVVCDVDCGDYAIYEPRIFGWKTPIEDSTPYLLRDEFKSNMIIKPYVGWENPAMPGNGEVGMGLS